MGARWGDIKPGELDRRAISREWLSSLPGRDPSADPPADHADAFSDYGDLRSLDVLAEGAGRSGTGADLKDAA